MDRRPTVFVGSSSEGKAVARAFKVELEDQADCEVSIWSEGVFSPGSYSMDSLVNAARTSDFAVMVATPDDKGESRGLASYFPRDNILLELGLFIGALGLERSLILCPAENSPKLPSDLAGVTRLPNYSTRRKPREAMTSPAMSAAEVIVKLGRRQHLSDSTDRYSFQGASAGRALLMDHATELARELDLLSENAREQGWKVARKTTALRLTSPRGRKLTLAIPRDAQTARHNLRQFANELRASGLRVNSHVREPLS